MIRNSYQAMHATKMWLRRSMPRSYGAEIAFYERRSRGVVKNILGPCAGVCMRDATRRHTACHEYDVGAGTCKAVRYEYNAAIDSRY